MFFWNVFVSFLRFSHPLWCFIDTHTYTCIHVCMHMYINLKNISICTDVEYIEYLAPREPFFTKRFSPVTTSCCCRRLHYTCKTANRLAAFMRSWYKKHGTDCRGVCMHCFNDLHVARWLHTIMSSCMRKLALSARAGVTRTVSCWRSKQKLQQDKLKHTPRMF